MKSWTEFHIAVVYYSGLTISLLVGLISLLYLRPFYYIKKITEGAGSLWSYNFITTMIIAGLLGGTSVSFVGCGGDYKDLLESPSTTILYGLLQVSYAAMSYTIMMGIWLFILIILHMIRARNINISPLYKIMCIALVLVGIYWIYNFR